MRAASTLMSTLGLIAARLPCGADPLVRAGRPRPALIACILFCLSALNTFPATVTGQIKLVDSKDSAVRKQKDFSGVAVWLTPLNGRLLSISHKHAQMLQKDKRFIPHVLAISTGTTVDFPNLDPIFHNAFSNFDGQLFDVALYPPGSSRSVLFDRAGIVRVFCNIHPSMSAIIVVANSNHIVTTENDGSFRFANVEPGDYRIHFFHERATPETLARLTQTITVPEEGYNLPVVTISEAGYIPVTHKNKYGRDYPPDAEKADSYSLPIK
jgi:plastocyanin